MKVTRILSLAVVAVTLACNDAHQLTAPDERTPALEPAFDDIGNQLDASLDAVAEVMALTVGGANGTTQLYVSPTNGDGKNGCNLTGSTTLVVAVASSNTSVATVSSSSITFGSCGDVKTLTVAPVSAGTATISISQTSNSTAGTFELGTATFTVNVAAAANTAPTVVITGVAPGGSYDKGAVPVAMCDVTDAEDGNSTFAATLSAITGPYASDGIGSQDASCSYTDGGDLTDSESLTYSIIDPSPPAVSYVLNPATADGSNGWYKSNVTLTWTVTEDESPNSLQKTGCVDQNITADQLETTYSCSATSAGGSDGPVEVKIKRDATAPTLNHTGNTPSAPNGNGWYNTDITANFTASDATSGLAVAAQASFSVTSSGEGTAISIASGTVADNAGNVAASIDLGPFMIDKTAPVVTVTGVTDGATYTLGSVPAAGCTTSDALSGVATNASLSIVGGPVGSVTANCSGAADNAGNSGANSVTYTVIYAWSGFFRPVDMPPIVNQVKAGSAIPVKFSLGGNQGLNIFETGFPKSVAIACSSKAEIDVLEETVTAGGSSLSYDPLTDQYNYVWKTDKSWAGSCRQLVVLLNDGTYHRANFNFVK